MWPSQRVDSLGLKHSVASSSKVASSIGLHVLKEMGGTAADAAVAMASVMNVVQPHACGLGGDIWVLYYENKTKKVHCLCGHGKSPERFTPDTVGRLGYAEKLTNQHHPICIGVPGAPALLCDLREKFGQIDKITLSELFRPAVNLARDGFVVERFSANVWREGVRSLEAENYTLSNDFLFDGQAPKCGQVMRNLNLAKTYENFGTFGKAYFYDGPLSKSMEDCVQKAGGVLTQADLRAHATEFMEPIYATYTTNATGRTFKIWETPMTSQGVVTLEALKILENLHTRSRGKNDGGGDLSILLSDDNYTHTLVEALRMAFADLANGWLKAEPGEVPNVVSMLSDANIERKARLFDLARPIEPKMFGQPSGPENFSGKGDTTYLCTADQWGNACSMVFSNYWCFGTSCVPDGAGFTLNNRLKHFWEFMHRKFHPRTRPFTTTMAGIVTTDGHSHVSGGDSSADHLLGVVGFLGGQAQPQAQLQILVNLMENGMSPQESIDRHRFFVEYDFYTHAYKIFLEDSGDRSIAIGRNLLSRGHPNVVYPVKGFFGQMLVGGGNIITRNSSWWDHRNVYAPGFSQSLSSDTVGSSSLSDTVVYWAGSDCRRDGEALCY